MTATTDSQRATEPEVEHIGAVIDGVEVSVPKGSTSSPTTSPSSCSA